MIYVELWKILFCPIRASWWPRLTSASWAKKTLFWYDVRRVDEKRDWFLASFLDMMYVEFMKNFLLSDSSELMAVRLISVSWAQKRLIPYFLDMMYVEFMKNFHLADSSELMAVRLISASWAQKRLIPTF